MILYRKAQINTEEKASSIYMPKQFKWEMDIPPNRSTQQKGKWSFRVDDMQLLCSFMYIYHRF